ncbi:hypothetical protein PVK06_040719 [Gossypium arboreum]|uniref:RNase H type-1 domain-containing protein n=1 Tax=Gossypium arboreum TaxID=29729 RepID=A0ABR0N716_GOSAR|nr:hypothetical protein PVK06_040719 [Gossypium arboreum]
MWFERSHLSKSLLASRLLVAVKGFVIQSENCNIDLAELWTLSYGAQAAWNVGFRKVVVESGSHSSVQSILKGVSKFHPHFCLTEAIREMLTCD